MASTGDRIYEIDEEGFLLNPEEWDEAFAEATASEAGITDGLTERHWEVFLFIRRFWAERGLCPTVYQTCRILGLPLSGFQFLFPSGYQPGACRLAGVGYRARRPDREDDRGGASGRERRSESHKTDPRGFLVDPEEWDRRFAVLKAEEMKLEGGLTPRHWDILRFVRVEYYRAGKVPTFTETCEANKMDMEEFEALFPDGYTSGALKWAGLR